MIGLLVLIIMMACGISWLAHTGALLKTHEVLKKVTNVSFLYIGLLIILVVKIAEIMSGMEFMPGEVLGAHHSEMSNDAREMFDMISMGLLYLGMGFVVFSFVMKLLQGKKETI